MRKALMIGSVVADVLIRVDHLPKLEEDVNPLGQTIALGGCCYNVSHMLELFYVPYTLFSPVGTGVFGEFVKTELLMQGIEPVISVKEENGACYCIVDKDGNRTFLAVHGAEYHFRKEWFDELNPKEYTDVYVCGLEVEETGGEAIIEFLQKNPHLNVFFAPSARIMHVPKERMEAILDCHPIVHLNRREAAWYLSENGLLEMNTNDAGVFAKLLYQRTGNTAIVTDGENGAYAYDGTTLYFKPAVKVQAVDGTGAGDCHCGTVMACLMMGKSLNEAMSLAGKLAAKTVTVQGAVLKEKDYEEVISD